MLSGKESRKQGTMCYKAAKDGDLVFGWGAAIALYAWMRNWIGKKKCMYLTQNLIISPPKEGLSNLKMTIMFMIYKKAFGGDNFYATVNSPELVDYYSSAFGCSKEKFMVVYDAMTLEGQQTFAAWKNNDGLQDRYVFCGGKAYRDIDTFVKVVKALPDINFKAIFLGDMITPEMKKLKNLDVMHDVEKEVFFEIMRNAAVSFIPLKSEVPCGVSVGQRSMLMGIPIVSTETRSMRAIIPSDEYGFLCPKGDFEDMARHIRALIEDRDLSWEMANKARSYMNNFRPEEVSKQLIKAMEKVMDKSPYI